MKTFWSILGGLVVLGFMVALPIQAEMVAVSDSDLSGITGKDFTNEYLFSGDTTTSITANGDSSANIQVGWYQWTDNHATETSDHKGANDQSGATTTVQGNVAADVNVINWGAWSQLDWVSATDTSGGTISQMAYGVAAIGGF
jgi:hypothetical protein